MNGDFSQDQPMNKKERREQHRQERDAERLDHTRRRRTKKVVIWVSIVVLLTGLGLGIAAYVRRSPESLPGVFVPEQGRAHIAIGAAHDPYSSNPPTSGPHYPDPVKAGVYDQPLAEEYLVHNMEHGHVILWYHCNSEPLGMGAPTPSGADDGQGERLRASCPDAVATMTEMVKNEFSSWKVVLVPGPHLDTRFALTAWTRVDKFNEFDQARVRKFIKSYRNKGPEATME